MSPHSLEVAVVGLGKIGLPLAAQYALKGAQVIGCDIDESIVGAVNGGECPIQGETGLAEALAVARRQGHLHATTDTAAAVAQSAVVVVIVPVGIDPDNHTDYRSLDAAASTIGTSLAKGKLIILESTVPVGTTRNRFGRDLARASRLDPAAFDVAYSPERVSSGRIFRDLAAYPKVVGGLSLASGERAAAFYRAVLDAEVTLLPDAETAEFTKLAESVYRDVNIALANELALAAEGLGVDYAVAARAANSQPFSHLHDPGVGVGGHCIPVYPYFLLETTPDQRLLAASRAINDSMAEYAVSRLGQALAVAGVGEAVRPLEGPSGPPADEHVGRAFSPARPGSLAAKTVLILGLAYRGGVKEAAFSSTLLLAAALEARGARVLVHDPLFSEEEVRGLGLTPSTLPPAGAVDACVLQAAHREYEKLDPRALPGCRVFLDGRAALDRERFEAAGITYLRTGLGR